MSITARASRVLQAPIADEAKRIIDEARTRGIVLRLLGGVAVKYHCPSASHRTLQREYLDLDLIGNKQQGMLLKKLLSDLGYLPNQRFNALHGGSRLMYADPNGRGSLDVFLDIFKMCHILDLRERLSLDDYTIPISDLLLTKLQIVEANEKDIRDLIAILRDHRIEGSPAKGEREIIDAGYVAKLCSNDWGLERTITLTLKKVTDHLPDYDPDREQVRIVQDRVNSLKQIVQEEPKALRWRLRARIGERVRWYDLPEVPIQTS